MKKFTILLATIALIAGNTAQAQTTGKAAAAAKQTSNDDFCWGIALVGLAVLGTVVGLTAASAASDPISYSNTK